MTDAIVEERCEDCNGSGKLLVVPDRVCVITDTRAKALGLLGET